jgi:hypothetical protein
MAEQPTAEVQRFRATNGRLVGSVGLALCAGVLVLLVVTDSASVAVPGVFCCLLVAGLIWMSLLRPSVSATATELRVRTLFETFDIPLASIDTVVVRRYLLVRSGGRRYICPAISRPLRKTIRAEMKWSGSSALQLGPSVERLGKATGDGLQTEVKNEPDLAYADFVEQRITALAANDRARRGIEERSEEEYELGSQVARRTAWLEIGVLVALAAALVVTWVVL